MESAGFLGEFELLANLPATPISQISLWLPDDWMRRNPAPAA
jgi:hypothetical protein